MKKNFLMLSLAVVLTVTLVGCGAKQTSDVGQKIDTTNISTSPSNKNDNQNSSINNSGKLTVFEDVKNKYIKAIEESDYNAINDLSKDKASGDELNSSVEVWKSLNIKVMKSSLESQTDSKVSYQLDLNVINPGKSAFEKGNTNRWLTIEKQNDGTWCVTALASSPSIKEN